MIITSFKNLIRTPVKTLLFVLLLAGATMLLVFGAVLLVRSDQTIDAVEEQFTTIATVEQLPVEIRTESAYNDHLKAYDSEYYVYDSMIPVSALNFEGANYIQPPENRPYYVTKIGSVSANTQFEKRVRHVAAFTALLDSNGSGTVGCRVDRVLYSYRGMEVRFLVPGWEFVLCQHFSREPVPLEKGKQYIATLIYSASSGEYIVYQTPFTSQYGEDFRPYSEDSIPSSLNMWEENGQLVCRSPAQPYHPSLSESMIHPEEISEDFSGVGGRNQLWSHWASALSLQDEALFYTLPTNSLELLPAFHDKKMYVSQGRAISQEEFDTGAKVVMLPKDFAGRRLIRVGDKIDLAFHCSLYGYTTSLQTEEDSMSYTTTSFQNRYSLLNAEGELYEPFWEDEYEVVGLYESSNPELPYAGIAELSWDTMIIPQKSVQASDKDNIAYIAPMHSGTASFQIPNGTIDAFDKALRRTVPEMANLRIEYHDNGYTEIMDNLGHTRTRAWMLCAVGLCSSIGIIILLLHFFVVKEKKRTAIERSLGMTKRQCRVSILSGLMVLALLSTALGSAASALALNWEQVTAFPASVRSADRTDAAAAPVTKEMTAIQEYKGFSTQYSQWAANIFSEKDVTLEESAIKVQASLYFIAPAVLMLILMIMAILLLNRNLKIEPILLLGGEIDE